MKAISLWQPWASLWLTNSKVHETRHWPTSYRGWLAVHAAKREIDDLEGDALGDICNSVFGNHFYQDLPRGAIIGAVDLRSAIQMPTAKPEHSDDECCGNWAPGRFAWRRAGIIKLNEPIPLRGRQSLFDVPEEIIEKLLPSQMAVKPLFA